MGKKTQEELKKEEQPIPEELQERFDLAAISRYLNALLEQENPTAVLKNLVRLGVIPERYRNSFERLIPIALLIRRGLLLAEELEMIFEQGIKNGSILPEAKEGLMLWLKEHGLELESKEFPADEVKGKPVTERPEEQFKQGEPWPEEKPREKKIKVSKTKKEILERLKEPIAYARNVVPDYLAEAVSLIYVIISEEQEPGKKLERIREEITGPEGLIRRYALRRVLESPVGEGSDEQLFQRELATEEYKLKGEMRKIIGTEALRIVEHIEANPYTQALPFAAREAITNSSLVAREKLLVLSEKTTQAKLTLEKKNLLERVASLVGENFPRDQLEEAVNFYLAYAAKRMAWQELLNVLFDDKKQRQALEAAFYVYEINLHILGQRLAEVEWHDPVFNLINIGKLLKQFIENQAAIESALEPERYGKYREYIISLADFVYKLCPVEDTKNIAFVAREIADQRIFAGEEEEPFLALYSPLAREIELAELNKRENELQRRYLNVLKQALEYDDFQKAYEAGIVSELSYINTALLALKQEREVLESERNVPMTAEGLEQLQQGLRLLEEESIYRKQALLALTEAMKLRDETDARRLLRKSRRLDSYAQSFQEAAERILNKLQQTPSPASGEPNKELKNDKLEFEEEEKYGE